MNKLFDVFAKGKRRKGSFSTLCCADNVCDNHSSRKIVFKSYQFDSDRYSIPIADPTFEIVPERTEELQNDSFESRARPPSGPTESFFFEPEQDCSPDPDEQSSSFAKLSLLPGQEQGQYVSEEKSRFKRQMYVIHISNSKNFHIGPQKTININPQWSGANESGGTVKASTEPKLILSRLLDCDEKLSEDYISLISLHLEKNWKEFGRNLGLEETFLEEQESRNGSNGILIAYDMLLKYITHFPNTSIGFVIYVLSEIHHTQLIEKLAQEMKSKI